MSASRQRSVRSLLEDSRPGRLRTAAVAGLGCAARIALDQRGIPSIEAGTRADAACALGYLTARDRLFQMDLLRRRAAGELAELLGEAVLAEDRRQRTLGLAAVAPAVVAALPGWQREALDAYARGVNAWIDAGPLPFELALLGAPPRPWAGEDSVLVAQHMMQLLAGDGSDVRMVDVMRATLPAAVADFLLPTGDPFATGVRGEATDRAAAALPEEIASLIDAAPAAAGPAVVGDAPAVGSNAWAVTGSRTVDGRAVLANDMHLDLAAPNVWYRARLAYSGARVDGVTVPGIPAVVAGSNGRVAWGATRLPAATADLVELELDQVGERYRDGDGWLPLEHELHRIAVRGGAPREHRVTRTRWGPVWGPPLRGKPLALRWTGLDPRAVDFGLLALPEAGSLERACEIVNDCGCPPLNVLLADAEGGIAWTVAGRFPDRRGAAPESIVRPGRGARAWTGFLDPARLPRVVAPHSELLVSANNLGEEHRAAGLGFNGFGGERAARIVAVLEGVGEVDEAAMLRLQHDVDAGFYVFYRDLLLDLARSADATQGLGKLEEVLAGWDGTASTGAGALPVLVLFRELAREGLLAMLLGPCRVADPGFRYCWHNHERPLRALLVARRDDLVPAGYAGYADFVAVQARSAIAWLEDRSEGAGWAAVRWGELNRAAIRHPLSPALADLAPLLDRPPAPLQGADECVCVARPSFGASLRLTVSPGNETEAILNLPGGQAGHPLEPAYGDEFEGWLAGRPSPLVPGEAVARAGLEPLGVGTA